MLLALKDAIETDARMDAGRKKQWIEFLVLARKDFYNRWVKEDVHRALFASFQEEAQQLLEKYLDEIEASLDKREVEDPITGESRPPDERFLRSVEEKIKISESGKLSFRQEVVRKAMVAFKAGEKFTLDNHSRLHEAIEQYLFEERRDVLRLVTSRARPDDEAEQKISAVQERLIKRVRLRRAQREGSAQLRDHIVVAGVERQIEGTGRSADTMAGPSGFVDPSGSGRQWYDLFSRGARDWLRHNDKVRAAVRDKLPELIAGSELLPSADRTVQVPVRFLEHSRFRLRDADQSRRRRPRRRQARRPARAARRRRARRRAPAATTRAAISSSSSSRSTTSSIGSGKSSSCRTSRSSPARVADDDYTREGWSRRGVRSRLDRRRSLKEAIKRRAVQQRSAAVHERRPALPPARDAPPARDRGRRLLRDGRVVEHDRARPPAREDVLLLGRAGAAPPVHASRGRVRRAHGRGVGVRRERSSSRSAAAAARSPRRRFARCSRSPTQRYDPSRFNIYVFYASDGANFHNDREAAQAALTRARRARELRRLRRDRVDRAAGAAVGDGDCCSSSSRPQTGAAGRHALSIAGVGLGRDSRVLQPPRRGRGLA